MKNFLFCLFLVPFLTNAQVVEEVIQLDTSSQVIKVIYKKIEDSGYYQKKVAVFANDTSQIAVEKSFNPYGQNGGYKIYYPSGRLKVKTVFANNKINGEWVWYDEQGIILVKGVYKNGVKFGYWAYKFLRIYGRYKKGYKHKKWKRIDSNEKKYISHYRMGKLKSGEGYGDETPLFSIKTKKELIQTKKDSNLTSLEPIPLKNVIKEYEQAISFLTSNIAFRKALKKHFATSMKKSIAVKKLYKNQDRFQFAISPKIKALDISKFLKESEDEKIVVPTIDAALKKNSVELKKVFSGKEIKNELQLYNNSTDKESFAIVTFSEVKMNLLRLDIDWTFKEEKNKFRILLYFENQILKGAEYEKRD